MTETRQAVHSGGCQCGAVRYALFAEPTNPHICHCRMCQKAFGGFFAPLAKIQNRDLAWTRGVPATFLSSPIVERGFCAACGTPLTFRFIETDGTDISLGSLDDPAAVQPARQYGTEGRLPWFAELHKMPGATTDSSMPADRLERIVSHQHPDHDTDSWPSTG